MKILIATVLILAGLTHEIHTVQAYEIIAWSETLDDEKHPIEPRFRPASIALVEKNNTEFKVTGVQHAVISAVVLKGVTIDQAMAAMLNKAAELDVPKIPEQPQKHEDKPIAVDLKFCAPRHISQLIEAAPVMAVYDPCRVTLVGSPNDGIQLMTVNLDLLIDGKQLPPDAQRIAIQVNQDMLAIISAGANPPGNPTQ